MLAKGNGSPAQCTANLLRIVRGEVPYQRMKGLDASFTDRPSTLVPALIEADAEWLMENYEPRVGLESIDLTGELAKAGHFNMNADGCVNE